MDAERSLNTADGQILLSLARHSLTSTLVDGHPPPLASSYPTWVHEPAASFVTLRLEGRLRGCLGSLEARRSLFDDLCHNAAAAGTRDPRFAPLVAEQLGQVQLEVTVLGAALEMVFLDEADVLAQLRPGIDGVVLHYGAKNATFLPQVWDSLPQPADFLNQLKLKAGWSADFWHPEIKISRYSVQKWSETPEAPDAP